MAKVYAFLADGSEEVECLAVVDVLRRAGIETVLVSVKAENERGTVFDHVKIRVDDSFTLEMHIDTDEANAGQIRTGDVVRMTR